LKSKPSIQKLVWVSFKNYIPTAYINRLRPRHKKNRLILFVTEISAVYSENHSNHKRVAWGKFRRFYILKPLAYSSFHSALNGYVSIILYIISNSPIFRVSAVVFFQGGKRKEREADHSTSSSA
jgi:hypothetical protein